MSRNIMLRALLAGGLTGLALCGCGMQPILLARWAPLGDGATTAAVSGDWLSGVIDTTGLVPVGSSNILTTNGSNLVPFGGGNIVATNGSNLVPLGGGNIISTNGSGVMPNGGAGGGFKILALDAFGAQVAASSAAVADANGEFRVATNRTQTLVLEATVEGLFLSSLVPGDRPASSPVRMSAATTIATEYLRSVFRTDKARLQSITHAQFDDLVRRVETLAPAFGEALELPSSTIAVEAFDIMRGSKDGSDIVTSVERIVSTAKAVEPPWPAGKPTLTPTAAMVGDVVRIGNVPAPTQEGEEFLAVAFNGSKTKARVQREGQTLVVTVPSDARSGPIIILSNSTPYATPQFEVLGLAEEVGEYPVPYKPSAMALGPDRRIWIASSGENFVVALDGAGREVARRAFENRVPSALWFDADGALWAVRGSDLLRLNQETAGIEETIKVPLGSLAGAVMSRDGTTWVPDAAKGEIARFDRKGIRIGTYKTGRGPKAMAADPSGRVWVANESDGTVQCFDDQGRLVSTVEVDTLPHAIACAPDGAVWVGHRATRSVWRIDPNSGEKIAVVGWTEDIQAITVDRHGSAWVGVSSGVTRVWADGRKAGLSPGPWVSVVDASGYLWQPTANGFGVRKLRPN